MYTIQVFSYEILYLLFSFITHLFLPSCQLSQLHVQIYAARLNSVIEEIWSHGWEDKLSYISTSSYWIRNVSPVVAVTIQLIVPIKWPLVCCVPACILAQYPCGYGIPTHVRLWFCKSIFVLLLSFRWSILQTCQYSLL